MNYKSFLDAYKTFHQQKVIGVVLYGK